MKTLLIPLLVLMGSVASMRAADPSDLLRLYEEEILAHDLYAALGKIHPKVMPLRNIPSSEMRHREAIAAILKADGIALPKPKKGQRFVSPGLDETYEKWLAEGRKSEADACRVGVRLEDHDIADLRKARADFPQHKEVLGQLEAASNNHLRAFHRNLEARGGDYTAEALTKAEIKTILKAGNPGCGMGLGCGKGSGCGRGPCGSPRRGNTKGYGWRGRR